MFNNVSEEHLYTLQITYNSGGQIIWHDLRGVQEEKINVDSGVVAGGWGGGAWAPHS